MSGAQALFLNAYGNLVGSVTLTGAPVQTYTLAAGQLSFYLPTASSTPTTTPSSTASTSLSATATASLTGSITATPSRTGSSGATATQVRRSGRRCRPVGTAPPCMRRESPPHLCSRGSSYVRRALFSLANPLPSQTPSNTPSGSNTPSNSGTPSRTPTATITPASAYPVSLRVSIGANSFLNFVEALVFSTTGQLLSSAVAPGQFGAVANQTTTYPGTAAINGIDFCIDPYSGACPYAYTLADAGGDYWQVRGHGGGRGNRRRRAFPLASGACSLGGRAPHAALRKRPFLSCGRPARGRPMCSHLHFQTR
jgi:hypothetical protein